MTEFRGVFPAIITPMDQQGELNEEVFRVVMEFNIQAGVDGFWVAGGTGESILLTDEENMRIAEIAADQNAGRINNIMHVGASTTRRAAMLAENAARIGVEAICAVPPFFYAVSDEAIVEHYRVIGAAAGLPLFAYNLPPATGVEITPDLMAKIQDGVPEIAGLKHSALNFGNIRAFRDMGLNCLSGDGPLMLAALATGASGCVDGPLCAAPELWVEVWKAYNEGDWERAETVQDKAASLYPAVVRNGYIGSIKAILSERLGVECGDARAPQLPLTAEQRASIRQEVERLQLDPVATARRHRTAEANTK